MVGTAKLLIFFCNGLHSWKKWVHLSKIYKRSCHCFNSYVLTLKAEGDIKFFIYFYTNEFL